MRSARIVAGLAVAAATAACLDGPPSARPRADAGRAPSAAVSPAPVAAAPVPRRAPAPPIANIGVHTTLGGLEDVSAIGAGDLDGDGRPDLVAASDERLIVQLANGRTLSAPPRGIPYLVAFAPGVLPRAALVAWGYGRGHLDAKLALVAYRVRGGRELVASVLDAPATERNAPVALLATRALGGGLLYAHYESKYGVHVRLGHAAGDGIAFRDVGSFRMAAAFAAGDFLGAGRPQLAVGRLYGDTIDAPGDAFLLDAEGRRGLALPTTRGVHSLVAADLDGDGRPELYVGDGWDREYGARAHALLTQITFPGGRPRATLVEDLPGAFMVQKLLTGDLDGDGRPELVAVTDSYVRVYKWTPSGFRRQSVAGPAADVALADLNGDGADELLLGGDRPEEIALKGAPGLFP